jgi:hypothetical protein
MSWTIQPYLIGVRIDLTWYESFFVKTGQLGSKSESFVSWATSFTLFSSRPSPFLDLLFVLLVLLPIFLVSGEW